MEALRVTQEDSSVTESIVETAHSESVSLTKYVPIESQPQKIRNFSHTSESVAKDWYDNVLTDQIWQPAPEQTLNEGVEGGFWVKSGSLIGYAKPRKKMRPKSYNPVSAIEKIASDLAYILKYPIPPNILYNRDTAPAQEEEKHCISLPPFREIFSYGEIKNDPLFQENQIKNLIKEKSKPVMSAMMVFDTWLQCKDHKGHYENLLISIENEYTCNFAYIDYAYSMIFNWQHNKFQNNEIIPIYDPEIEIDLPCMIKSIEKIKLMNDDHIDDIVERIPDFFLDAGDKETIKAGLKYRRDNLSEILKKYTTGEL